MSRRQRIRLIALDLDGTLLDSSGGVPERNRVALRRAALSRSSGGVVVALASGRMTDCIEPTASRLGMDCPVIAYNGALVRDSMRDSKARGREIIFHRPVEAACGERLVEFCRGRYMLNFYWEESLYAEGSEPLRPYAEIYARQTGARYNFLPDLRELSGREPTKLILITDPPERDRLYGRFARELGEELTIIKTNPEYLEFLNKGADKGVALMELAQHYGFAPEEVMAFGDGDNDAPMLAAAGTGIALANGSELAKASADVVSELDNDSCAVAEAVERLVLS